VTRRVPISPDQITMDDVWDYYETIRDHILQGAEIARQSLSEGGVLPNTKLLGKSAEELDAYFERLLDEADKQASLFLIAAAEAVIRVDFLKRVYERRKDSVSRAFRSIYQSQHDLDKVRVRLVEDILDTWAREVPTAKTNISTFKRALRFRHWLAHGRYWDPKLDRKYDPNALILIVRDLFGKIGATSN
jgi:hypothetical protein